MPGMNGFEVLDCLDETPATERPPIILFTAKQLNGQEKNLTNGRIAKLVHKGEYDKESLLRMIKEVKLKL